MKKHFLISALAVLIIGAGLWSARAALASSYEWLSGFLISPSHEIHLGESIKVYRTVNTTGAYEEYRSAYYAYSTSTSATTTPSVWTEWTECRASSTVNGSVLDSCFPTVPTSTPITTTSTVWIRVTTNFGGCGTWTPTPDVANCGDESTTSTVLLP